MEASRPSLTASAPADQVHTDGGQYLTLRLGGEEYAIDILQVQEIRGYDTVTQIANAPPSSRA